MFNLLSPYNYHPTEDGPFLEFITSNGFRYIAYFVDGSHYFVDYPIFSSDVVMFNFDLEGEAVKGIPHDVRVGDTICAIVSNYLLTNPEKIIFFVCDSADKNHTLRMRIFRWWRQRMGNVELEKYDRSIKEPAVEDLEYHTSVILHKDNPIKELLLEGFMNMSADADK